MNRPWRKNVLTLVLAGYATVVVALLLLVFGGKFSAAEAYELIQSPLMALIGGSLAIAKDLIQADCCYPTADDQSPPAA